MNDDEIKAEAERLAVARITEKSANILRWTKLAVRPLFVPNVDGEPVHIGSCVLLRIHDVCFAVTAGHVLDNAPGNVSLYIGSPSTMIEAGGDRFYTDPPFGDRALDRIDVGFVRLTAAAVARLTECQFLTIDQIDVDDLADYQPVYGTKYLAMGYPHDLAEVASTGTSYKARLVPWTGNPRGLKAFPEFAFYESSHVMLEFDPDRLGGELGLTAPLDPTGMSGGALFRFGSLVRGSHIDDRLVGILIEKHIEKHGTILASRLAFVLEGIRERVPALDPYIPRPRNLRINVRKKDASSEA